MASFWQKNQFVIICTLFQLSLVIIFAIFGEYSPGSKPILESTIRVEESYSLNKHYSTFQDVHIMIFFGIGYLLTFIKRYGYSALGMNFLLGSFSVQWSIVVRGFVDMLAHGRKTFEVGLLQMILGDFTAAVVLITMCVMLGKLSPTQYIVMAFFEVIVTVISEHFALNVLLATDVGGSMVIHVFAAYFGLAMAKVMHKKSVVENQNQEPEYHSDIFSMIGTLILWVYWPSFNSMLALPDDARMRAALNTYLSMSACCMVSFLLCTFLNKGKFVMEYMQNATLAGGVAIGTSANLVLHPFAALIIGSLAGIVSVLGFRYSTTFLANKLRIHDACGVNNLHGYPGIFAGIIAALVTLINANKETYGESFFIIYSAMDPNSQNRTKYAQALYQLAALGVSIVTAIIGGLLTGYILKLPIWNKVEDECLFLDDAYWQLPETFDPYRDNKIMKNHENLELEYHHKK